MIEEKIQWFTPDEKLPEEYDSLLISCIANEIVYKGFYSEDSDDCFNRFFNVYIDSTTKELHNNEVKYWAYLPKGPE